MRVLVGDETGLLKSIELEKNEQRVICSRAESQTRARGVERLSWYQDENQDAACRENVVVARANSVVEYYSAQHVKDTREPEWSFTGPTGKTVGLDLIEKYGSVVRCTDAGDVFIKNTLSKGKPATFNVGADLERMRLEPTEQTHIATGGKERDLNIWSLERQEAIFKAKNVTHDKLDMRVPVWIKDLHFLSQGSSNGHRVVVGTGHRHLRLYDTNTKRRPVQQIEFGEYPINAMCVSPDETRVFVADTTGCLDIFDLRMLRHMGRLTGPNGAIRDIACHPTLPYVAAVGLDRFVHVFDVNTRKYQHMIYAKQRLNAVLFCNDGVKDVVNPERASKRRKEHHGDEAEPMDDDEDDEDEEEEAYEGLEISDAEEEDDDDEDDDEDDEENFHFNDDEEDSD